MRTQTGSYVSPLKRVKPNATDTEEVNKKKKRGNNRTSPPSVSANSASEMRWEVVSISNALVPKLSVDFIILLLMSQRLIRGLFGKYPAT